MSDTKQEYYTLHTAHNLFICSRLHLKSVRQVTSYPEITVDYVRDTKQKYCTASIKYAGEGLTTFSFTFYKSTYKCIYDTEKRMKYCSHYIDSLVDKHFRLDTKYAAVLRKTQESNCGPAAVAEQVP